MTIRKQLECDIKRKFGPVLVSKKLKEQRQEIISDALERYDEEIQNGATEPHAYSTAFCSLGDLKLLRLSGSGERKSAVAWLAVVFGAAAIAAITVSDVLQSKDSHTMSLYFLIIGLFLLGVLFAISAIVLGSIGILKSSRSESVSRKSFFLSVIGLLFGTVPFLLRIVLLFCSC